jgi:hypothetical protein
VNKSRTNKNECASPRNGPKEINKRTIKYKADDYKEARGSTR